MFSLQRRGSGTGRDQKRINGGAAQRHRLLPTNWSRPTLVNELLNVTWMVTWQAADSSEQRKLVPARDQHEADEARPNTGMVGDPVARNQLLDTWRYASPEPDPLPLASVHGAPRRDVTRASLAVRLAHRDDVRQ